MHIQPIIDPSPVWDRIGIHMMDDSNLLDHTGMIYGVFDGDVMAGAFLIKPWSVFCYEVHGGVNPDYWGRGKEVCWTLGNGLFDLTPCIKIVAIIPKCNRLMIRMVRLLGMKHEGTITKSFMKNMKIHDLEVFGIQKRERK